MKFKFNRRYNTIAAYVVIVFAICLVLVMLAFRADVFKAILGKLGRICAPIIWGCVIAYLLNPPMKFIEKWLGKLINRKKEHRRLVRALAVAISLFLVLAVLISLIASIIPEVMSNVQSIANTLQSPVFLHKMEIRIRTMFEQLSTQIAPLQSTLNLNFDTVESFLLSIVNTLELNASTLFSQNGVLANLTSGVMSLLGGVMDGFLGLVLAFYLLYSKEKFQAQAKKLVCALFTPQHAAMAFRLAHNVNHKFTRYYVGVVLDCLLVGVISFLFLSVLQMPYALLISLILAITKAIPIFGMYIGTAIAGVLMLLFSPVKALILVIFCLVFNQINGNIITPKILGDQLGLSAFWIMCAVFLGGGLFGFAGMIVAPPLFAVIYSIGSDLIAAHLEKKGLPSQTSSYMAQPESSDDAPGGQDAPPPDGGKAVQAVAD